MRYQIIWFGLFVLDWQTIGESDSADVSWTDHVIPGFENIGQRRSLQRVKVTKKRNTVARAY